MSSTTQQRSNETNRPEIPETTDAERWENPVVGAGTHVFEWGTHRFPARAQQFDGKIDGKTHGHVEVSAPADPPPSAEDIIADGLAAGGPDAIVARALADGWDIDVDELEVRR